MTAAKKIILYSADWCGPCKSLKEELDVMLKDRKDVEVLVVDVDKNPESGVNRVHRVCLITQDENKCEGVADCVEGAGVSTMEKIKRFIDE